MSNLSDNGKWKASWTIDKFNDPDNKLSKMLQKGVDVKEFVNLISPDLYIGRNTMKGNLLLNTGIDEMWNLIVGDSADHFSYGNCKIGVGDDSTAAQNTDTDLISVLTYVTMDSSYPTSVSQAINFRSTFSAGIGTGNWQEFTIKQDTSSICLNRKVEVNSAKGAGETWVITLTITLS